MKNILFPLIVWALSILQVAPASITLTWLPSPSTNVSGYLVYSGPSPRVYTNRVNVGKTLEYTRTGLIPESTYFFGVTAYGTGGLESLFSNEINYTPPSTNTNSPPITNHPPVSTASIKLNWTKLNDTNVTGYRVYVGYIASTTNRVYYTNIDVGQNITNTILQNLSANIRYAFKLSSKGISNSVSEPADEILYMPGGPQFDFIKNITNSINSYSEVDITGIIKGTLAGTSNATFSITATSSDTNMAVVMVNYNSSTNTGLLIVKTLNKSGVATISVNVNDGFNTQIRTFKVYITKPLYILSVKYEQSTNINGPWNTISDTVLMIYDSAVSNSFHKATLIQSITNVF